MTSELKIGAGARNSLWASFLIMGIASMAWVPRIPEIKDAVGLSNGQFGFVFLGSTIGSVLGSQFAGRAIHTFGVGQPGEGPGSCISVKSHNGLLSSSKAG